MNLNDLILEAEEYRPIGGGRRVPEDEASLSNHLVIAAKLLGGRRYVKLAWNAGAKLLVARPAEESTSGALKGVISPTGSAVFNIGSYRKRMPDLLKGRVPVTLHGGVIVIGVLPEGLASAPTVELRGTTAQEMVQHLHDVGTVVSEGVARAIAAQAGMSVTAVRDIADKVWAAGRQPLLAGVKGQGATDAQIKRQGRRANGDEAAE